MEKKKNVTSKIKAEIVLSLLRGEDPELISREYGVTLADINLWRDQFIGKHPSNYLLIIPEHMHPRI